MTWNLHQTHSLFVNWIILFYSVQSSEITRDVVVCTWSFPLVQILRILSKGIMTTKKYVKSILKKFHQQSYRSLTVHRLRPKRQDERLSITDERHSITKSDLKNIKIENNHCKKIQTLGARWSLTFWKELWPCASRERTIFPFRIEPCHVTITY